MPPEPPRLTRTPTVERRACGARTRAGGTCKRAPMANGRCPKHGGKTPIGPALPQYKHGRYSKALGPTLAHAYEAARADPERLALGEHMALLEARIAALVEAIGNGEGLPGYAEARAAHRALRTAIGNQDPAALAAADRDLAAALAAVEAGERAWAAVQAAMEQYRKLADAERRRMLDMRALVSADEAVGFAQALVEAVRRHVTDDDTLRRLHAEMADVVQRTRPLDARLLRDGGHA